MLKEKISLKNYSQDSDAYLSIKDWKLLTEDLIDKFGSESTLSFDVDNIELVIVEDLSSFLTKKQEFIPFETNMTLKEWKEALNACSEWFKESSYLIINDEIDADLIVEFH